ncbi:hypothetical protein WSM22_20770 [Cytophagales bacterium WSM2-2]|nr:hypothetical protein WSM22_20770 [Cytophagales bacterium WSM2-2]
MKNKLGLVMIIAFMAAAFSCDTKKAEGETSVTDAVKKDSTGTNDTTKTDTTKTAPAK